MLPGATVPCTLADRLAVFRPCFTAPFLPTFIVWVPEIMLTAVDLRFTVRASPT
jgi:hypothetical protein